MRRPSDQEYAEMSERNVAVAAAMRSLAFAFMRAIASLVVLGYTASRFAA